MVGLVETAVSSGRMNRLPEKLAKPAGVLQMVGLVETAVSSGRMNRLPEKLAKPARIG